MVETTEEYRNRINQLKTEIETEPLIKEMREDIAEGISKTGNRQADIEEQFQEVIDNTTGKDVISAPELIAARNGKSNLKTRIDDLENETNAQLAQNYRNVLFYGVKNDGSDTEDALNALEGGYTYIFPKGIYGVRGFKDNGIEAGFIPKDNTTYIFQNGASINVLTNGSWRYSGILLDSQQNVVLVDPVVNGDRLTHNYSDVSNSTTHERGAGIMIRGNAKVTLENPITKDTTGDGIDIIAGLGSDITINYGRIENARRNGFSLESVDRLRVNFLEIEGTNGTAPECGLDVEPFNDTHICNDVVFNKIKITNSGSTGVMMVALNNTGSIQFDDCEMDGLSFSTIFTDNDKRKIVFNRPNVTGGDRGITFVDSSPNVEINDPTISVERFNPNYPDVIFFKKTRYTLRGVGFAKIRNAKILNPKKLDMNIIGIDTLEYLTDDIISNVEVTIAENEIKGKAIKLYTDYQVVFRNCSFGDIPNSEIDWSTNMMTENDFMISRTITNKGYVGVPDQQHNINNASAGRIEGARIKFINLTGKSWSIYADNIQPNTSDVNQTIVNSGGLGSSVTLERKTLGNGNKAWIIVEKIGSWV